MKNKKLVLVSSLLILSFIGCSDKATVCTPQAKCYYPELPTNIKQQNDLNVSIWKYEGNNTKPYVLMSEEDFTSLSANYKEIKEKLKILLSNITEFNSKAKELNK